MRGYLPLKSFPLAWMTTHSGWHIWVSSGNLPCMSYIPAPSETTGIGAELGTAGRSCWRQWVGSQVDLPPILLWGNPKGLHPEGHLQVDRVAQIKMVTVDDSVDKMLAVVTRVQIPAPT